MTEYMKNLVITVFIILLCFLQDLGILRKLEKIYRKKSGKTRDTEGTFSGRSVMLLGEGSEDCNLKKKHTSVCLHLLLHCETQYSGNHRLGKEQVIFIVPIVTGGAGICRTQST